MTNQHNTVLYTGVNGKLNERVLQHKNEKGGKFTAKYHVVKLVYYECHDDVYIALNREEAIKGGSRQRKFDLVNGINHD